MRIKKGFTLSEVMIAIVIVGVIAAVLIPTIMHLIPDQNKVMYKSANFSLENAVKDVVSNSINYPQDVTNTTSDTNAVVSQGLANVTTKGNAPSNVDKFCYLLSQSMHTVGTVSCSSASNGTFKTADGIQWTVIDNGFPLKADGYSTRVIADVNGDKLPNCGSGSNITNTCSSTTTPDKYEFGVRYDGKIDIKAENVDASATCDPKTVTYKLGSDGKTVNVAESSGIYNCPSYTCGASGYTYDQSTDLKTIYAYDSTAATNAGTDLTCNSWTCGSGSSGHTTPNYALSGTTVTETYKDGTATSYTCPVITWNCGASGYTYVQSTDLKTILEYDSTAANAGTNLTCNSWTCGASGYTYTQSTDLTTIYANDSTSTSAGTKLTCNSWTCGAGSGGHTTPNYELSGTTVAETYKDGTATSYTCPVITWACGASGYSYGQSTDSKTVFAYDVTAANAGKNLTCNSWACGSSSGTSTAYSLACDISTCTGTATMTDGVSSKTCPSTTYNCASSSSYALSGTNITKTYSDSTSGKTCAYSYTCGTSSGSSTAYSLSCNISSCTGTKTTTDGVSNQTCPSSNYSCSDQTGTYTQSVNTITKTYSDSTSSKSCAYSYTCGSSSGSTTNYSLSCDASSCTGTSTVTDGVSSKSCPSNTYSCSDQTGSYSQSGTTITKTYSDSTSSKSCAVSYTCGSSTAPGTGSKNTYSYSTDSNGNATSAITQNTIDITTNDTCSSTSWTCGSGPSGSSTNTTGGYIYTYDVTSGAQCSKTLACTTCVSCPTTTKVNGQLHETFDVSTGVLCSAYKQGYMNNVSFNSYTEGSSGGIGEYYSSSCDTGATTGVSYTSDLYNWTCPISNNSDYCYVETCDAVTINCNYTLSDSLYYIPEGTNGSTAYTTSQIYQAKYYASTTTSCEDSCTSGVDQYTINGVHVYSCTKMSYPVASVPSWTTAF